MLLTVLGINHKTAPLELLERVVFAPEDVGRGISALADRVAHGVILSTCNRVEVYGLVGHPDSGRRELLRFLAEYHGLRPSVLEPHVYVYSQEEAVRHLFEVAAGLDSMMVGETQVLGQVRAAYALAKHRSEPGAVLARLFHQAIGVGRRAHRETRIAGAFGSLSAAAVDLARERLGDLGSRTALVVGAGGTGRLTARTLQASGAGAVLVANRTAAQAEAVARSVGGEALTLDALEPALARADVLISSTGARDYLVETPTVRAAMSQRPQRPLYCIDLAVPRDVEPSVAEVPNVHLYNLDDLHMVCGDCDRDLRDDMRRAERIVEEEVQRFFQWWDEREVIPTIAALRAQAEAIREAELNRALGRMGPLSERERDTLNAMTAAIISKLLHQPTVRLKERSADHDGRQYIPAVRALFALPDA